MTRAELRVSGGAALTTALGVLLLRLALTGQYRRYVRVGMHPWLVLSGAVLVGLGLWSLRAALRPGHAHDDGPAHDDEHDGHGHAAGSAPRAGLLLLAPLLVVLLVAPPALGAYAATRTAQVRGQLHPAAALPPAHDGAVTLTVGDFVSRTSVGQDLTRGRFRLTGFATPDPAGLPGRFLLTRLSIVCCAADAQSVTVPVVQAPSMPRTGAWLTVVGSEVVDDAGTPELQAVTVTPVATPPDPYE